MKLKPANGRAVRDPVKGTLLPETGADVVVDSFWRKRLRDGDVVEVTDTATTSTATTTTASSTASTTASAAATATTTTASTASADTTTSTEASS